jgi:hypothetical protein
VVVHIEVTEPAVLAVDLGFSFPVGLASMTLTRRIATKRHTVAANPTIVANHAHLLEILLPGNYAVVVHDPTTDFPSAVVDGSTIASTPFSLRVQLVTQSAAAVSVYYRLCMGFSATFLIAYLHLHPQFC